MQIYTDWVLTLLLGPKIDPSIRLLRGNYAALACERRGEVSKTCRPQRDEPIRTTSMDVGSFNDVASILASCSFLCIRDKDSDAYTRLALQW